MNKPKSTVDRDAATEVLRKAIEVARGEFSEMPETQWLQEVGMVMSGKHLTFRYILVTALLGKATDGQVNPLALQAGADLVGAYDARSLCHKVVVPLERSLLARAFGGSNEPFLNKPARFTTISPENAVKSGGDKSLLILVHQVLSELQTSQQAFDALCHAVKCAIDKQVTFNENLVRLPSSQGSHLEIIEFLEAFLAESIEGQTAAIAVGTVLSLHFGGLGKFECVTHPVNQSGASSREVADIDIKKNGQIFVSIEVKDKLFKKQDVEHAAFKVSQYGLSSLLFVVGVHGGCVGGSLSEVAQEILAGSGVNVTFVEILPFLRSIVALCPALSFTDFLSRLQQQATKTRVKDEVFDHINAVVADIA
jgi:SacI restriction endonuclease